MKRTLLVDTNRAAVPIYRALCDLGHEVWVVGAKPGETLAKLASNYTQIDYSDTRLLADFVEEKAFDYLVPGCTDISYLACAEINRGRFPCIDKPSTTKRINNKQLFRELAEDIGLPVPRKLSQEQAIETEAVMVKPIDSFSGQGISLLHRATRRQLDQAWDRALQASASGRGIIEEFVTGQLFSHSAFILAGKVVADFIVQEDSSVNPFAVDLSRVAEAFPQDMLESLRSGLGRLCSELELSDGLIHTQFISDGEEYWIIEATRRCPGDIYAMLIELTTGYAYAANYVAPFIGGFPEPVKHNARFERITRHTVTSKQGSALWGYQFSAPVDIRLFVPLATSGDYIQPSPYGRAGIFFFHSTSKTSQEKLYQSILDRTLYSIN
ncbi:MAG: hypothetical protein ABW098_08040 [Candidatus Thiodiazotropha sp.]